MKIKLECPNAEYRQGMRIFCKADGGPCGHVYYRMCKGWWALSDGARKCTRREEGKDGSGHETAAGGGHEV